MTEIAKDNSMLVKCKFKECKYEQWFEGWTFKESVEYMKNYVHDHHTDMECCHELELVK